MSFSSATNSISAIGLVDQPRVEFVQLDSLVVMKIVKHGDIEFYAGMSKIAGETCQGILTGLIAIEDRKLEVTNCFSTTRPDVLLEGEEAGMQDAAALEENKQNEILEMLKRFRTMNIDYELVGFYQAHPFGACFNHDMMESLVDYQMSQQNGVVLIYDPIRTRQGNLTIRAYRLSRKALELALNGEWTPELTKQAGLNFANFFEELPVVVKNSHLMNVLLAELALANNGKKAASQLELGTKRSLERSMKAMMGTVDELNKSVNAYTKYSMEKQKYDAVLNTLLQKRIAENETRQTRGEPPLSLDEIRKQLKQPQMLAKNGMLDLFLSALDTNAYSKFQIEATSESIAKLHLSQAVTSQQPNPAAAAAFGGNLQQQTAAAGSNERR